MENFYRETPKTLGGSGGGPWDREGSAHIAFESAPTAWNQVSLWRPRGEPGPPLQGEDWDVGHSPCPLHFRKGPHISRVPGWNVLKKCL